MPDLTPQTVYYCKSMEEFKAHIPSASDPNKKYTVRHERLPEHLANQQGAQYGFTCECQGFLFRGKCAHIEQVQKAGVYCGWNSMFNTKGYMDPIEETNLVPGEKVKLCPNCMCYVGVWTEMV